MSDNLGVNAITGSGFVGNSSTVIDQILGVKNQFRPKSIDDAYQVAVVSGGNDLITWDGTVTKIPVNFTDISPVAGNASMDFMEGTVVTQYSSDGAKAPRNVTAASGSGSGEIDMTWTNPTDTGTGNPSITGRYLQYRTGNADWTTEIKTPSAILDTITGLSGGSTYQVRVAVATANGLGTYSIVRIAVATA